MPTLTDALVPQGALVSVQVGLSAPTVQILRAALRPVPSPASTRGLLDTGAELTCVDSSLVQSLGLTFGELLGRQRRRRHEGLRGKDEFLVGWSAGAFGYKDSTNFQDAPGPMAVPTPGQKTKAHPFSTRGVAAGRLRW